MQDLKVVFMGTPEFAQVVLEKLITNTNVLLVVTQPDKLVGRKKELKYSAVKQLALKENIPVFQPTKIKEDYAKIIEVKPDIIITCAYGQIIPKEILDLPRLGCINVHASLLPKLRGGAPIHKALINGEEKTGITIMYMDEKMDTGDIISQEEYKIQDDDNVGILHEKLAKIGADLLIKTLPGIIDGTNKRFKQDETKATYAYNIKREEEHLDFSKTGQEILNQIRGLNPWPLANLLIDDLEYKVYKAYFLKKVVKEVGQIIDIKKDAIGITCQDGVIYLTEIKPFGKKHMSVQDYLNGVKKEKILAKFVK